MIWAIPTKSLGPVGFRSGETALGAGSAVGAKVGDVGAGDVSMVGVAIPIADEQAAPANASSPTASAAFRRSRRMDARTNSPRRSSFHIRLVRCRSMYLGAREARRPEKRRSEKRVCTA